jgi:hypothetical protein
MQIEVNPGVDMTTVEAIAFGIMLAWTPGLIVLAFLLWDVPELEEDYTMSGPQNFDGRSGERMP